jgi:glycerol-3-phosphate acyltransferase PlsY
MIAFSSVAVFVAFLPPENPYFVYFCVALALFIVFTHRRNVNRMIRGKENRSEKAMIFKKRG